jgi:hypothetical protein
MGGLSGPLLVVAGFGLLGWASIAAVGELFGQWEELLAGGRFALDYARLSTAGFAGSTAAGSLCLGCLVCAFRAVLGRRA